MQAVNFNVFQCSHYQRKAIKDPEFGKNANLENRSLNVGVLRKSSTFEANRNNDV